MYTPPYLNNSYNAMYPYPQPMPVYQSQQYQSIDTTTPPLQNMNSAELIFVTNIQQAREYVVPRNTIKYFMNTSTYELYAKSADNFGITNFKASRLSDFNSDAVDVQPNTMPVNTDTDSLKSTIHTLENRINTLEKQLNALNGGNKNESVTTNNVE